MKASIIVTTYKDLASLETVLDALKRQTYKEFEVVVAEDDDAKEVSDFLDGYRGLCIKHVSHSDTGRNKVVIQNKAIAKSSGDYLFFIDGDIVPFKHFVEYSLKIAKPRQVLSGRRVNLSKQLTALIKNKTLDPCWIEDHYTSFFMKHIACKYTRAKQGLQLNPDHFVYKKLISRRKRNSEILGCNFSCFKSDIESINGFDEGYGDSIIGQEDTDLTWRFRGVGCLLKSSKNIANCFHLWHKENTNRNKVQDMIDIELMKQKQRDRIFVSENGLDKYYRV